jgi:hypothetical protein
MVRDKVGRHRTDYSDVTIFAPALFDAVTEHVMVSCAFLKTTDGKSFEQIFTRPKFI